MKTHMKHPPSTPVMKLLLLLARLEAKRRIAGADKPLRNNAIARNGGPESQIVEPNS